MKVIIEIDIKNSIDIVGAINAVSEIYEMSESVNEISHIEGGGSLEYNIIICN